MISEGLYQGSLVFTAKNTMLSISNIEYLSYDAWGRRRDPATGSYTGITPRFDRGYTMHEHYDGFTLINMNGRLYAPVIGRMLQPDIVIQGQYNSQAYNAYSYCLNNPLRFTDPSGYAVMPFSNFKWDYNFLDFSMIEKPNNGTFNTELTEGKHSLYNRRILLKAHRSPFVGCIKARVMVAEKRWLGALMRGIERKMRIVQILFGTKYRNNFDTKIMFGIIQIRMKNKYFCILFEVLRLVYGSCLSHYLKNKMDPKFVILRIYEF